MKTETLAIKTSKEQNEGIHPVSSPLYLSTTFLRNEDGSFSDGFRYSRLDNPNRRDLERTLAILEKGKVAVTFSSGMAAVHALFQSLSTGDHIILPDDVFFNVKMLAKDIFQRWGLSFSLVDVTDEEALIKVITEKTKLIWLETPSNPQMKITNIKKITAFAQANKIMVAVDNTWPTPILSNPLEMGADVVMHSTTKYFGGHSDVMGGCLIFKTHNNISNKSRQIQLLSGAVPSPFDCWLLSRGIKTMPLRVKSQSASALRIAKYLCSHPKIESVFYPGLPEHPHHHIAKTQMKNGYGSMIAVLINGSGDNAITVSNNLKLFTKATSLGGVESLVEHRKSVEGINSLTPNNLLRISIGLEHADDLIDDLNQALKD
ncbi:trans-sulfuration enzyme family protein [Aquimarina rubra]|uniref:Trans-sulfuration enzyme family protein n=1 Tax=Aquimarina rubra TaxID=1920033 RepID=A0ABW5LA72_9FLAO